ncbi:MAG TPA: helix-turn-helix domain-containing protein [Solirubrobacterales bacterium]|nr:helix-turn-helix domain-containing protein [Solirubrobacterales bacterium]
MSEEARAGELRLDPESIEALACRLAELLSPGEPAQPRAQLITAEEVARWWGISRRWVYDHADELGAHRLGGGRRPRLRFDPDEVAERLGEPGARGRAGADERGSAPMRSDCGTDSLSARRRAMVGRQAKKRPGRRANAPRPGAGVGGAMQRLLPRSPHVAPACPAAGKPGGNDER